jgi:REP element-mobilizing transposase RayT
MLDLLVVQKARQPFFLYAYCLMPNHIHLLMERREVAIGRVMHRLLNGYSRYYNKRYGRVGHLFQSRYKGILCQSDQYLAELVRYIHLNPVRARIVSKPQTYRYSSHRAYIGLDEPLVVDIEPVLRHFGATKKLARSRFGAFVKAGIKVGHREEFYQAEEGRILGSEEFVDELKKRVGEIRIGNRPVVKKSLCSAPNLGGLIEAAAKASHLKKEEICSRNKRSAIVRAKEAMIFVAHELGGSNAAIAKLMGVDSSLVSRRLDSARCKMKDSKRTGKACDVNKGIDSEGGEELRGIANRKPGTGSRAWRVLSAKSAERETKMGC